MWMKFSEAEWPLAHCLIIGQNMTLLCICYFTCANTKVEMIAYNLRSIKILLLITGKTLTRWPVHLLHLLSRNHQLWMGNFKVPDLTSCWSPTSHNFNVWMGWPFKHRTPSKGETCSHTPSDETLTSLKEDVIGWGRKYLFFVLYLWYGSYFLNLFSIKL